MAVPSYDPGACFVRLSNPGSCESLFGIYGNSPHVWALTAVGVQAKVLLAMLQYASSGRHVHSHCDAGLLASHLTYGASNVLAEAVPGFQLTKLLQGDYVHTVDRPPSSPPLWSVCALSAEPGACPSRLTTLVSRVR